MEREEIVKITEEGGRRESGDGGEGGASWGLMVMSSAGLGGCRSAVQNRAISSKQRFLYPLLGGGCRVLGPCSPTHSYLPSFIKLTAIYASVHRSRALE